VTLPNTQPQRPVSGFAIATLVLGVMGIVLPAVICGIVALGQIRDGSYSGRGMVMTRLLISAAWVFPVAAFAASVCNRRGLRPRHEFADILVPRYSPGRMARRHPDRSRNSPRFSSGHTVSVECVSRPARRAESHIGDTQTFSSSPGYPYTDSGDSSPGYSQSSATRRRGASHVRPPDLRTVSCRADARLTWWLSFPTVAHHRFDETDGVHIDAAAYTHFRDRYRAMATSLGFEGHMRWAEAMP
jgi:hypothetical protein